MRSTKTQKMIRWTVSIALGLLVFLYSPNSFAASKFPTAEETSDVSDILEDYLPYAQFVLEIGRELSPAQANKFATLYNQLKKRDKVMAAKFLKGLRFEMNEKVELMGAAPSSLSTRHPEMRKWVVKYLPEWNREIDERMFRSYSTALSQQLAKKSE